MATAKKKGDKTLDMMSQLDEIYKSIDIKTLEKLLSGDVKFKKRYLVDMIDQIFTDEIISEKENMELIKDKIAVWAQNNEVPSNVLAIYLKQQLELEQKKLKDEQDAENSVLKKAFDSKEETATQKLCREYGINIDNLLHEANQDIVGQVSSFCVNKGAFYNFKKSSTIDRALKDYNKYIERAQELKERQEAAKQKRLDEKAERIAKMEADRKAKEQAISNQRKKERMAQKIKKNEEEAAAREQKLNQSSVSQLHENEVSDQQTSMMQNTQLKFKENQEDTMDIEDQEIPFKNNYYQQQQSQMGVPNEYTNQYALNDQDHQVFQQQYLNHPIDQSFHQFKQLKKQTNLRKDLQIIERQNLHYNLRQVDKLVEFEKKINRYPQNTHSQNNRSNARDIYYQNQGQSTAINLYRPDHRANRSIDYSQYGVQANRIQNNTSQSFFQRRLNLSNSTMMFPPPQKVNYYGIQKPYADIESHNQNHMNNIKSFKRNGRSTSNVFLKNKSQQMLIQNSYCNDNESDNSQAKEEHASDRKVLLKQQQKVKNLLEVTGSMLDKSQSAEVQIKKVNEKLLEEEISQVRFIKITQELNKLREQKPEYLRQFYEQTKLMDMSISESEIQAKDDYEKARTDHKLWNMLEKDRKKKQFAQQLKKAKKID